MPLKHSFALKISLYIITCVVIIFMAVLIYNYYVSKNALIENIEENTKNLANSALYQAGIVLSAAEQVPEDLAFIIEFSNFTDSELQNILKNVVSNTPEIYGSTVSFEPYMFRKETSLYGPYYHKSNDGIKYVDLSKNYDYLKSDWYTIPKKLGKGVWSEPYFDEGGGEVLMVTYSQPCYKDINGKKTFIGVATADISLEWLISYFSKLNVYRTGYAFLISANGTFIVHKNRFYVMKETIFSLAEKRKNDKMKELGGRMIKGETGFEKYYSETLKKQCYLRYIPFVVNGWSIGIVVPEDELFHHLRLVTIKLFIMGLIGYILTLSLIVVLAHRITMPLRSLAYATKKIGKGDFQAEIPIINSFDEIGVLSRSFISMQTNLISYIDNLKETTAAKEKIEKELSIAHEIQQSILPHNFPRLRQFDMYATLIPAREVGGDLYDFFFIDDKRICFAIGDVSGKGVSAALFMAIATTLLRAKISLYTKLGDVVNAMNRDLCKNNETAMFVTFFLCILDTETGDLEYCNAGHNPPLIRTANKEFHYFHTEEPSPPLGIVEDAIYTGMKLKLSPGDIFFLYTDGITEAMNKDYVQFSEEKLLEFLNKNKNETVMNIVNNVKESVEEHASGTLQSDDITMIVLKYNG